MKATQLLRSQHDDVKALFSEIEAKLEEGGDVTSRFEEVAHMLVAHDAIERELFYPACEEVDDAEDILGESLVEHGLAEFSLYQADVSLGDPHFAHKCTVLKEVLLHHIEEEEKELFPKVESALSAETLEQLATRMSARFEQVRTADFRGPLLQNLQQVLSGKVELDEDEGEDEAPAAKSRSKTKPKGRQKRGNSADDRPRR